MDLINNILKGYNNLRDYMANADLVVFIIISIIVLYFLMYLVSFFFQLPVIMLFGTLVGYYIYTSKSKSKNKKIKTV